jgi:hypothetical protein
MRYNGLPGDCFLVRHSRSPALHLAIVCSDEFDDGTIITVNVTSKDVDMTVCIYPDEHRFITKESYIGYQFAAVTNAKSLLAAVEQGEYLFDQEPIEDKELLLEIQQGFLKSRFTPNRIKELMRKYLEDNTPF